MKPGELELQDRADGDKRRLALAGELDLATAPRLETAIAQLCAEGAKEVLLDLRDLAFVDSTGLQAVLVGKRNCDAHGCRFRLTRGQHQVERVFEIAGLRDWLPLREPT